MTVEFFMKYRQTNQARPLTSLQQLAESYTAWQSSAY